jgi:tetratricopeptide (TPR) repeat protein
MARGRFREALDVLNEAIRLDPRYAESFDNRAAVFERLGMYPQADADRRKVAALGGVRRPPPPPPDERRRGFDRRARTPDRPQMPPLRHWNLSDPLRIEAAQPSHT